MRISLFVGVLLLSACGGATPSHSTAPAAAHAEEDAAAGVVTPALAALLRESWARRLAEDPVFATSVGERRFDGAWPDLSVEAHDARVRAQADELSRARALEDSLDPADRLTFELFVDQLEATSALDLCRFELWNVSPMMRNPIVTLNEASQAHPLHDAAGRASFVARLHLFGRFVAQDADNLRRGVAEGRVAPRVTLERTVAMVRRMVAEPTDAWAPVRGVLAASAAHTDGWPATERAALLALVRAAIDDDVRPALARYADSLERDVAPHGRDETHEGVAALPDGPACYAATIRYHTTTARTAAELHALGLSEVAATDARLAALGATLFHTDSLQATIARAQADPSLGYATGEEIMQDATARIAAATAASSSFFGRVPDDACRVEAIPPAQASDGPSAYYSGPAPDGSRPGVFMVNTARPETRRRYLMGALAAHEAVPGHHLQVSLAARLPSMPAFRRNGSLTAYVEGWGLYAERLADEMGLYHDDLDRFGAADLDAWRASRLVVDTGLHSMGWTRTQAEDYLRAHTTLADDLIVNEVDRYINTPGQALAYKVGQLELVALRRDAETALGARFDRRAFHDLILGLGPVTLPALARQVHEWIARTQRATTS
jgi:uncharacterized protein (DUF885 family)